MEMESRSATVDGAEVRWRVAGAGPPLVIVHGLAGSWRWWRPVLPALAAHREVHLVDLPHAPPAGPTRQRHDRLAAWFDAAGLERASVVGHSLGGHAAAQLAGRDPDRVDRLVLAAPVGVPTGRRLAGHALPLALSLARGRPAFVPLLARDALRTGPASLLRGALEAARADLRHELAAVRVPTLLVWGERDALVPAALGDVWREALVDVRLARLPRAGHIPMFEAPDAFVEVVLGFLEEPLDEDRDPARRREVARVSLAADDGEPPAG
jgi:pimeloyl-ACP methyl ester carboxylesterase